MVNPKRHYIMSRIKSKNTKAELRLGAALSSRGIKYKKWYEVFGKPDIVLLDKKVAVFVDGCFWHGCPYHWSLPKTNVEFWTTKFRRNRERDAVVNTALDSLGWKVLRFWECWVKDDLETCVARIRGACA